jgi:hypothetical protein
MTQLRQRMIECLQLRVLLRSTGVILPASISYSASDSQTPLPRFCHAKRCCNSR